jgi:ABC-2 type transport system ATP-binding protein
LRFFATLAGVPQKSLPDRVDSAMQQVGLGGRKSERVETYSRGMKQRLHIARAILNNPSLLLLDEPSIGLDPEGARDLRQLVRAQRESGCGVLLTTHYLEEARELADELLVIHDGEVAARGSADDIAALGGVDTVTTSYVREFGSEVEAQLRSLDAVSDLVVRPKPAGYEVDLVWTQKAASTNELDALFRTPTEWVTSRPVTLEEAYLAFIAKAKSR